jgi:hypothetical protein
MLVEKPLQVVSGDSHNQSLKRTSSSDWLDATML